MKRHEGSLKEYPPHQYIIEIAIILEETLPHDNN